MMSKPDPAGGSLENILASIRMSLSEQSTDVLGEAHAAPADQPKDAKPARKEGLTQRLAGATADASAADKVQPIDDLSDLLEDQLPSSPSPQPVAASTPAATPAAGASDKDPLWFLTRKDEPAPAEAGLPPVRAAADPPSPEATAEAKAPAAEPKLTRPEVLRASMPPFFGSSAEAAKAGSAPAEAPAPDAIQPPKPPLATATSASVAAPPKPTPVPADAGIIREAALVAAAEAAALSNKPGSGTALRNGKAEAKSEPSAEAKIALAGDSPHNRALEVMVLDLLKPMLQQWVDQNMPRLMVEALKDEVARARASESDTKKT